MVYASMHSITHILVYLPLIDVDCSVEYTVEERFNAYSCVVGCWLVGSQLGGLAFTEQRTRERNNTCQVSGMFNVILAGMVGKLKED